MTEILLDYLKSLCEKHVEFNHSANNIAYYEFDWVGLMSESRRNDVVLYVHRVAGNYLENKGDNKIDKMYLVIIFYKKVGITSLRNTRKILLDCKRYAEEFRARTDYDRANSDDKSLCAVLNRIAANDWMYEQTDLSNDGWIGLQVRIPISLPVTTSYDSNKWQ